MDPREEGSTVCRTAPGTRAAWTGRAPAGRRQAWALARAVSYQAGTPESPASSRQWRVPSEDTRESRPPGRARLSPHCPRPAGQAHQGRPQQAAQGTQNKGEGHLQEHRSSPHSTQPSRGTRSGRTHDHEPRPTPGSAEPTTPKQENNQLSSNTLAEDLNTHFKRWTSEHMKRRPTPGSRQEATRSHEEQGAAVHACL